MGMYDLVLPEINLVIGKCPICKNKFSIDQEWQTKSYKSLLFRVSLRTLKYSRKNFFEVHTICNNCNSYIKVYFDENPRIEFNKKEKGFNKNNKLITKPLTKKQLEIYEYVTMEKETLLEYGYDE